MLPDLPEGVVPAATTAMDEIVEALRTDTILGAWTEGEIYRAPSVEHVTADRVPSIAIVIRGERRANAMNTEHEVTLTAGAVFLYDDPRGKLPAGQAGGEIALHHLYRVLFSSHFALSFVAPGEGAVVPSEVYGGAEGTLAVQVDITLTYLVDAQTGAHAGRGQA
jgi:hypothetical protein